MPDELDGIIDKMIADGVSDSDIQFVVGEWKTARSQPVNPNQTARQRLAGQRGVRAATTQLLPQSTVAGDPDMHAAADREYPSLYGLHTVGNIVPSAVNLVKNLPGAAMQMGKLALGNPLERAEAATGMAEGLGRRYGGIENIKRTLHDDPVGMAAEVIPAAKGLRASAPAMAEAGRSAAAMAGKAPGGLVSMGLNAMGVPGIMSKLGGVLADRLGVEAAPVPSVPGMARTPRTAGPPGPRLIRAPQFESQLQIDLNRELSKLPGPARPKPMIEGELSIRPDEGAAPAWAPKVATQRPELPAEELLTEVTERGAPAAKPAKLSPQAVQNQLGMQARRQDVKLSAAQYTLATQLVEFGMTPAEAVTQVGKAVKVKPPKSKSTVSEFQQQLEETLRQQRSTQ